MNIGGKLKERRKQLKLTMLEVAKKANVSEATVSRWESGDIANMKRDKIVLLAKALQVSPSFIMEWEEEEAENIGIPYDASGTIKIPVYGNVSAGIRIRELRKEKNITMKQLGAIIGVSESAVSQYETGKRQTDNDTLIKIADYFGCSTDYLLGREDKYPNPSITNDYVTFPILGEIAAGFDLPAMEDWDGEAIEVPTSYFKGRNQSEFFVLKVKGNSMYPIYHNGDVVLILKQTTLDYSGQIGAILYDNEYGSLKKIEYKQGENWLRLVSLNPDIPPRTIEGSDLEKCQVLGIPWVLIRKFEQ